VDVVRVKELRDSGLGARLIGSQRYTIFHFRIILQMYIFNVTSLSH
jgi:hypothetical protein